VISKWTDDIAAAVVVVKTVLLLCDSLSAIDDIRNGVLCSLVSDLMNLLAAVRHPTTHVTVCLYFTAACDNKVSP